MKENKFSLKDYYCLWLLSLKDFFFRVDGRDVRYGLKNSLRPYSNSGVLFWVYLILSYVAYIYPLTIICTICLPILKIFMRDYMFGFGFSTVIWNIILLFVLVDMDRLKYNLKFKESAWWKNTGVSPSEIIADKTKGVCGEYRATMAAEILLEKNGLEGKIFNNVFVPKKQNMFTEIDLVLVSESGIYVIETKAISGELTGFLSEPVWKQRLGKTVNEINSPLFQNRNHCNYLMEYMVEKIQDESLKKKIEMYDFHNTVLFTMKDTVLNLKDDVQGDGYYICFAEGKNGLSFKELNLRQAAKKIYTKAELQEIMKILDKISHYSKEERKRMIEEREIAHHREKRTTQKQSNEHKSHYMYYAGFIYDQMNKVNRITLVRDDGEYKFFYNYQENSFCAIPYFTIVSACPARKDRWRAEQDVQKLNELDCNENWSAQDRQWYEENLKSVKN